MGCIKYMAVSVVESRGLIWGLGFGWRVGVHPKASKGNKHGRQQGIRQLSRSSVTQRLGKDSVASKS